MKIVAGTLAAGASVAGLFLRFEPKVETRTCPPAGQCESPPLKDDGKCEAGKGEADPASPTFDPFSCGFCGDGIRQFTASAGSRPRRDEQTGELIQDVTERPSETPETCPIDFHCGNGRQDIRQPYVSWFESRNPGASETAVPIYSLGIVYVTESGGDCPRDFPDRTRRARTSDGGPVEPELAVVRRHGTWYCPSMVATGDPSELAVSQSASTQSIVRRVNGTIIDHAAELRQALGADETTRVVVSITLLINSHGDVSVHRASATCGGRACGDQSVVINSTRLTTNGLGTGPLGAECYWEHSVIVPPTLPAAPSSAAPSHSGKK